MWVYAFGFASKEGVYFVTDKGWRTSADQICATAEQQRLALQDTKQGYISNPTHAQMIQRADIVDRATDIIEGMLNDVAALPLARRQRSRAGHGLRQVLPRDHRRPPGVHRPGCAPSTSRRIERRWSTAAR